MHLAKSRQSGGLSRVAGIAALGFVAGIAATQARKGLMQAPSLAAGDWVRALEAEHRMVEGLFRTLQTTSDGDALKRNLLLTKIAYALSKHGIQEENVIYPALGHTDAERARRLAEEHQQIKTFIYDLRNLDAKGPLWLATAKEFELFVEHHVREEEDEVFPEFKARLSADENAKLTGMMNWEGFKVA